MKKLLNLILSRASFTVIFMIIQFITLIYILQFFQQQFVWFYILFSIISIIVSVNIINGDDTPEYKTAWIIPVTILPIFGIMLYLVFGKTHLTSIQKKKIRKIQNEFNNALSKIKSKKAELEQVSSDAAVQSRYLENSAHAPVYTGTTTEYFKVGDDMFPVMIDELKKAKKFIFLEYFIIQPGKFWNSILEVLEQKVKEGVDVRLMYDDLGCLFTLPKDYYLQMESKGIKCCAFHRFLPVLSNTFNTRDHRKICVVDGNTAFTGGINLADEYINEYERHGHWLDCGIMLKGDAVWSFTVMFLSMWDYEYNTWDKYENFAPHKAHSYVHQDDGFVQPYTDSPVDSEYTGEAAYINMLNRAKKYVYICTPYLIVDSKLLSALCNAAKSGIDVRIITPGIADKEYVHILTRSYYSVLIDAGVKIYEYAPGFIHSKTFVSDDTYGICGTINLDYRSLYLHYECAVWMYDCKAILQMKDSYFETLEKCNCITKEWCNNRPFHISVLQKLLRIVAPLM